MFCKKCGSQIPDNSAFCPECGAAVSAAQAEPKAAEQPSNAPEARAAKPAMNKHRLIGIIAVGAAALGVIIIFVAILAGGGKDWKKVLKKEMKCIMTGDSESLAELIPDKMYEAIADYYDVDAEELKEYFMDLEIFDDDDTLVKYEIIEENECSSSDLKSIKEYLKERGISSKNDVKEAVEVNVKCYFKDGDGDRFDTEGEFGFVKINGEWYHYGMIVLVCQAASEMSWSWSW